MNPFLSTLVLLAGVTQISGGISVSSSTASPGSPVSATLITPTSGVSSYTITSDDTLVGDSLLQEQAQAAVLVLPTPDLTPENVGDLTEDLTVMCRIFAKSVAPESSGVAFAYGNRPDMTQYLRVVGQQDRAVQSLYLDGYGALFFLDVDYPLAPTETQESTSAKPADSTDAVWTQTIREMSGQTEANQAGGRTVPVYDPARVDSLKKTLVKTLAHASNIRLRRPQDVIALVVGDLDNTRMAFYQYQPNRSGTRGVRTAPDNATSAARNPAAALLVLRVIKADVDAFAQGQLTLVQFTDRVQTLWSSLDQGTPETRSGRMKPATR